MDATKLAPTLVDGQSTPAGEILIASAAARRALKQLRLLRACLPSRHDGEQEYLANFALLLVKGAKDIRAAVDAIPPLSSVAKLALNAAAAPLGPARLDDRAYSNAHECALTTARTVLDYIARREFNSERIRQELLDLRGLCGFQVTIPGGDDQTEIARQYGELTARVNQESGAAIQWLATMSAKNGQGDEAADDPPAVDNAEQPSLEARALAMLTDHPDWTDTRIAEAIQCNRSSLYRLGKFKAARKLLKRDGMASADRGSIADGRIEAWGAGE